MRKLWTLFKRELGEYFNSPIAYIAIVAFLVIVGAIAMWKIFGVEAPRADMRPVFEFMPWVMVGFAPALAMRLLAEEKSAGTMELLITMPVQDWQVVTAKFLAAFSVLALAILATLPYPIVLTVFGELDKGVAFGGYLGMLLMGSCYISVGLLASSWVKNQVVAFIVGAGICLLFTAPGHLAGVTEALPETAGRFAQEVFGLGYHFKRIAKGILDSRDVFYYASITLACLLLTAQSVQSRKWR